MQAMPEVVSALPRVTAPKIEAMRAVSDDFALTGREHSARKGKVTIPGKDDKGRRPPKIAGYEFYRQGKGWACRSVTIDDGRRRRKYLGYLSGKAWAELQRSHSGADLRSAVLEWIRGRAS